MYLIPIPALVDSYVCTLHEQKHALVVKPGEAGLVMATGSEHGSKLESILVMHREAGHAMLISIGNWLRKPTGQPRFLPGSEPDNECLAAAAPAMP